VIWPWLANPLGFQSVRPTAEPLIRIVCDNKTPIDEEEIAQKIADMIDVKMTAVIPLRNPEDFIRSGYSQETDTIERLPPGQSDAIRCESKPAAWVCPRCNCGVRADLEVCPNCKNQAG
jgi:hypothetical protein